MTPTAHFHGLASFGDLTVLASSVMSSILYQQYGAYIHIRLNTLAPATYFHGLVSFDDPTVLTSSIMLPNFEQPNILALQSINQFVSQFRLSLVMSNLYTCASVPTCTLFIVLSYLSILTKHTLTFQHNNSTIISHIKVLQSNDYSLRRVIVSRQQDNILAVATTKLIATSNFNI